MRIELDIGNLKENVAKTRKALEKMKVKNDKLTKSFISESSEELNYIAKSAIDKFYESYEPLMYERTYDLYHTYRITVTENEWSIDFDPSFMEEWHRVDAKDPTYIFENSFIRGWHGGAISGEGHPNPGVPYWREPINFIEGAFGGKLWYFTQDSPWHSPSLMSPSPYKEIVRKSNVYMKVKIARYHSEYNANVDKFRQQMIRNLERIR